MKNDLRRAWFFLMKPLAYLNSTERKNERYHKKREKITEKERIQWIAEDIAKYIVARSNPAEEMVFVVADYVDRDDLPGYESLAYISPYLLRRKKTQMAYYKKKPDVLVQKKIVNCLAEMKGMVVKEEKETFTWQTVRGYEQTYLMSYHDGKNKQKE